MPAIDNATIIIAYDISDDSKRMEVQDYLLELGARRRTESVYELVYRPPSTPEFGRLLRNLRRRLEPMDDDSLYLWDLDQGHLRRVDVHKLGLKAKS